MRTLKLNVEIREDGQMAFVEGTHIDCNMADIILTFANLMERVEPNIKGQDIVNAVVEVINRKE